MTTTAIKTASTTKTGIMSLSSITNMSTDCGGGGNTRGSLLQHYLDKFFKFPKDIKSDIIYCQRALKAHIKVHQMVLDVFQTQENADPVQKKRILNELETEIYEINAEQQFLFLRLRRNIEQFIMALKKDNIPVDGNIVNTVNALISRDVVPYVSNEKIPIMPFNVGFHNSEKKLIEKYFEVQKHNDDDISERNVFEIIDSDDDEDVKVLEPEVAKTPVVAEVDLTGGDNISSHGHGTATRSGQNLSQMSLLKPMAQRLAVAGVNEEPIESTQMPTVEAGEKESPIELPVSKNVKQSRMNLRQALKRARTGNMAAKAAAALGTPTPSLAPISAALPVPALSKLSSSTGKQVSPPRQTPALVLASAATAAVKKADTKSRTTRGSMAAAAAAAAASKATEINSSSEDSNASREASPPHGLWPYEPEETRTLPEHYGQEMFLRLFQLFTPEMHIQMQQRRSKRKRRTVHSNERADFHYGRIEYGSFPPPEDSKKKRKAFLLSPQVKRNMPAKRSKRSSAEKHEGSPPSRSSSSSPDEKRCCNECLKGGGCLDQCTDCKGYFHQSCHRDQDEDKLTTTSTTTSASATDAGAGTVAFKKAPTPPNQNKSKLCPACNRTHDQELKKEAQQYKTLHHTAKELELKMAKEKHRRASLQQEGSNYKLHMNKLYKILNVIKSDPENDNSEE